MERSSIRHTELPGTSRLVSDYLYQPDRVRDFYGVSPYEPGALAKAAGEIRFSGERREALVAALARHNEPCESLELLRRPDSVAVLTGQQVGLYSGPAYTIYKALTAAKLAKELTAQGTPAVPVFWLASEDHDFAEVNHCWVFDPSQHPRRLEVEASLPEGGPVGLATITRAPAAELRETLSQFPFGEQTAELVCRCYRPGATLGDAFRLLLKQLTSSYGLLFLDPMIPEMRALMAEPMRAALRAAPEITARLLERGEALKARGYHAQVHMEQHTSLFFLLENGRRYSLRRQGEDYLLGGRRLPVEELLGRAADLSPNALLRPVIQDSILPTVAYIGGPAELAYLAQSAVIYQTILGRMPAAFLRAGFTLLDRRCQKAFRRYDLKLRDFSDGEEALRERIAGQLIPPSLQKVLEETRDLLRSRLTHVGQTLSAFDVTLLASMEKSQRKMEWQLAKLGRKIGREMLARDERASEEARYVHGMIYPERHLQERLYSIIPFLAKHGTELVGWLWDAIQPEVPDHQLLII